jgi:uncharacterized membrane protein
MRLFAALIPFLEEYWYSLAIVCIIYSFVYYFVFSIREKTGDAERQACREKRDLIESFKKPLQWQERMISVLF